MNRKHQVTGTHCSVLLLTSHYRGTYFATCSMARNGWVKSWTGRAGPVQAHNYIQLYYERFRSEAYSAFCRTSCSNVWHNYNNYIRYIQLYSIFYIYIYTMNATPFRWHFSARLLLEPRKLIWTFPSQSYIIIDHRAHQPKRTVVDSLILSGGDACYMGAMI